MESELSKLCNAWKEWAIKADRSEDGWESYFPHWRLLIDAAERVMSSHINDEGGYRDLELCWAISGEGEELADYSKDNIDQCWTNLCRLALSSEHEVRWQVYEALSSAGPKAKPILLKGLSDTDPYCRRRAMLSLIKIEPKNGREIAAKLLNDSDPYNREVALKISQGLSE